MRKNLKLLRISHDLRQDEMATRLGVSRTTYCKVEKGKSNGTTGFWLALKREFPDINIEEMADREKQAKNHSE